MEKGVVKFYNEVKGFGFIKTENGSEIFVHASGLVNEIKKDDRVKFDIEQNKKGEIATNVILERN